MKSLILAIDQGTTSSRALLFDEQGEVVARAQQEFPQLFPRDGWVEHDPEAIWSSVLAVCKQALAAIPADARVAAIGITNQRETTVIWRRSDGKPIANAIVWQDRRTAEPCRALAQHGALVQSRTGLLLDPYFSATKVAWLLDNVPGARAQAERGELCFGTIDTFLLWRLSGGKAHATDASNASRTMLFDIHKQRWDDELLKLFNVPRSILPEVRDNSCHFGDTALFGASLPITGMAGDQQAAAIGQACVAPGMMKSTYGTGCFVLVNTGANVVTSHNRLLSTVAYRLSGKTAYALEGSIFNAGTTMQWLRDKVKLIAKASDSEALAKSIPHTNGVYLVPAFTGLGAPYWDPAARGALVGLTRDSGIPEIVRAGLESVAYQTRDLIQAMADDGSRCTALRVDGGMVNNNWLMQFLADILGLPVERPSQTETTVFGAAYLAGMHAGVFPGLESLPQRWSCEKGFKPGMAAQERDRLYAGWNAAVGRVRG